MAKKKFSDYKRVEQYEHKDKKRINIPPVGLVTEKTDTDYGQKKKKYKYDPHLDPELTWDAQKSRDDALEAFEKLKAIIKEHEKSIAEIKNKFGTDADDIVEKLKVQHADMIKMLKEAEAIHKPNLKWAGKAERTSFEVPTVSLHVHERIDPKTIIETVKKPDAKYEQLSMFEEYKVPFREAIEFYKHKEGWTNRLIAGDSLLVLNSLLEKEGMGGKVQMIYFDPPYGISYGSNFQPFTNERDVKNGKDEDLTQEPEMIKAFRDTWELGIHSYLTYLRDRLLLAKELLHESGSVFVQISDENLHHVKEILDEIFGSQNLICLITVQKAPYATSNTLPIVNDYLCWYAKNKSSIKYRQLFKDKSELGSLDLYRLALSPDKKSYRPLIKKEWETGEMENGWKRYRLVSLISQGASSNPEPFEYNGKKYYPPAGSHWKVKSINLNNVAKQNRIQETKNSIQFRSFVDDFPITIIHNIWTDTITGSFTDDKVYVVQTNTKIIERCINMVTDPGDLVLDITCGSGTTAFVSENWGRRWITCDTSRIAITLTKQRLLAANYEFYELSRPEEGIGSGFKYKTVPHITLKNIANNEPPGEEILYDQPLVDNKKPE